MCARGSASAAQVRHCRRRAPGRRHLAAARVGPLGSPLLFAPPNKNFNSGRRDRHPRKQPRVYDEVAESASERRSYRFAPAILRNAASGGWSSAPRMRVSRLPDSCQPLLVDRCWCQRLGCRGAPFRAHGAMFLDSSSSETQLTCRRKFLLTSPEKFADPQPTSSSSDLDSVRNRSGLESSQLDQSAAMAASSRVSRVGRPKRFAILNSSHFSAAEVNLTRAIDLCPPAEEGFRSIAPRTRAELSYSRVVLSDSSAS